MSSTNPAKPLNDTKAAHLNTKANISPSDPSTIIPSIPPIPTLDTAPPSRRFASYVLLLSLVIGAVVGGWFLGFDLLQVARQSSWTSLAILLASIAALMGGVLFWTGVSEIDIWETVHAYWWWSLPLVGAGALALTMMQERATDMKEVE
jgi:hypothetical protein